MQDTEENRRKQFLQNLAQQDPMQIADQFSKVAGVGAVEDTAANKVAQEITPAAEDAAGSTLDDLRNQILNKLGYGKVILKDAGQTVPTNSFTSGNAMSPGNVVLTDAGRIVPKNTALQNTLTTEQFNQLMAKLNSR